MRNGGVYAALFVFLVSSLSTHAELSGVALFVDANLSQAGLTGSYVNQSLQNVAVATDWRTSRPIAGTRVDRTLEFATGTWGSRSAVGITGGSDANWENFSVQWDGFIQVTDSGQRVALVSDDGSRMWIDLNRDGTFGLDELIDNGWGRRKDASIGDRSRAISAGTYSIRIQYYEVDNRNECHLVSSSWGPPRQFSDGLGNPRQVVRVLGLNYEPRVPSEGNRRLWEVFGWNNPRTMAQQFEADLEFATGGAVDFQIVEWRDLDEFPTFIDGFRYNPDNYVALRRANTGFHEGIPDFTRLARQQELATLVNSGQIDEIWGFCDHYFGLFGEAWMAGPNSFFINGPSYPDAGLFNRAIAGYGFNYERGIAEMLHNLCHRVENHGQRAFGSWNLANPLSAFDKFSANFGDSSGQIAGVGTCHFPANADTDYDYSDPRVVPSTAFNWPNYPNLTGETRAISRSTWGVGPVPDYHRDYLNFYFGMIPRNDGTDADGRQANWFKYIWDFNGYEPGTGRPREEDAFGAAANITVAGGVLQTLIVRYYDTTGINPSTLDSSDVVLRSPQGLLLSARLVDAGTEVATTAGSARTVTYQIDAPGGAWDGQDAGIYTIEIGVGQVTDTLGNPIPAGEVGRFSVQIADPSTLNIAQMLLNGQATVQHTTFDIGPAANLFDGSSASLIRTPNIDPAVVTLSFAQPQPLRGFSARFSHAGGDPAYEWSIETADTQPDLDNRTGSWQMAVGPTGTPSDVNSTVMLPSPVTATFVRLQASRLTGDNYVHVNEWQLFGQPVVDATPPTVEGTSSDVSSPGRTAQFITISISDDTGVDVSSLHTGDIRVTGPNGFSATPVFYDVDAFVSGSPRTATYWIIPPDGSWKSSHNGTYSVGLEGGQIGDIFGNIAPAKALGTFTVNVPPPAITRQPQDQTVNEGATASFNILATGAGPLGYQWRFNGSAVPGRTNSTLTLNNVQPVQAGGYDVVVSSSAGAVTSQVATLTVRLKPAITVQPSDTNALEGQTVEFHVAATGSEPLGYQWRFNGTPLPNQTNATLTLKNLRPDQAGTYDVLISNPAGSVTSSGAILNVRALDRPPLIIRQPADRQVFAGEDVGFDVLVSGTEPFFYRWLWNGDVLQGATNAALALKNVPIGGAGLYSVMVSNSVGAVQSRDATLTVSPARPPSIVQAPQNISLTAGGNLRWELVADGAEPLTYQWHRNGQTIDGATNSTFELSNVQPPWAGEYFVEVSNPSGKIASPPAVLSIVAEQWEPLPDVPFIHGVSAGGGLATDGKFLYAADLSGDGDNDSIDLDADFVSDPNERLSDRGIPNGSVRTARYDPETGQWSMLPAINPNGISGDAFSRGDLNNPLFCAGGKLYYYQFRAGPQMAALYRYDLSLFPAGVWTTVWSKRATDAMIEANAGVVGIESNSEPVIFHHVGGGAYQFARADAIATGGRHLQITPTWTFRSTHFPRNGAFAYDSVRDRIFHLSGDQLIGWSHNSARYPGGNFVTTTPSPQAPVAVETVLINSLSTAFNWRSTGTPAGRGASLWGNSIAVVNSPSGTLAGPSGEDTGDGVLYLARGESSSAEWPYNEGRGSINNSNVARFFLNSRRTQTLPDAPFSIGKGSATAYLNGSFYITQGDTLTVPATGNISAEGIRRPGKGFARFVIGRIAPPAIVRAPQNHTIRAGDNAALEVTVVSGGVSIYQWRRNGEVLAGQTNRILTLDSVKSDHGGLYSVIVSNAAGSVTSDGATLTVLMSPTIASEPLDQTVDHGKEAGFAVIASGTPPLSYQWHINGMAMLGQTNATLTLSPVTEIQAGLYTAVVANQAGAVTSRVAMLTVLGKPVIVRHPVSLTLPAGTNATFQIVAVGASSMTFAWLRNENPIESATADTYRVANVTLADSGAEFVCMVSNLLGVTFSETATLTVTNVVETELRLEAMVRSSSGEVSFRLTGPAARSFEIEISANLIDWTPLRTLANPTGTVEVSEIPEATSPTRFYRARLLPP